MMDEREWLEPDGLGGFASGTVSGVRSRRYHALLLASTRPPAGRMVLVNGFDAWVDTRTGTFPLSAQHYAPGVLHPDGARHLASFEPEPWPTWQFELPDGTTIRQEIVVQHGASLVAVSWTLVRAAAPVTLIVRPFVSGRDYHATHHENGAFDFTPQVTEPGVAFLPYAGLPRIWFLLDGQYRHEPLWYRNFLYTAERERGLDDREDLASPGELRWALREQQRACCLVTSGDEIPARVHGRTDVAAYAAHVHASERARRAGFPTALDRAADAYLVRRRAGLTIVAGYPWFTDWGRDTFIAIRGLCLATGRLAEARDILVEWASSVSEGMLPNRFPDGGEAPEYNTVDASLWYVVACDEFLRLSERSEHFVSPAQRDVLRRAVHAIVAGYAGGTRFGIRLDEDGLLAAGAPGVQLTWMDARVGDRVITPRVGKPVEVQALWLNALAAASRDEAACGELFQKGRRAFVEKFWDEDRGLLADVIDVWHERGTRDDTFRPNQILAIGGLPLALLDGERARRIVDHVEARLLTPLGLRSLAPGEPGYSDRYEGGPAERDAVYHQGTAWPWLMGPFVEAWVRVRGNTAAARREARQRFLQPLLAHLREAGLGHVSEIADAEAPHTARGCPFQAWSLGEIIRLDRVVLASPGVRRGKRASGAQQRRVMPPTTTFRSAHESS